MKSRATKMETRSGTLKSNSMKKDNKKPVFICDCCQKEFSSSSDLKHHMKIHTGKKDHHCNLCEFSTSEKGVLTVHIRRHLNERPFKCEKINCGAGFAASWDLKTHQNVHNKNNKNISCSVCPFKTHVKSYLNTHVKNVHSESKPIHKHFCSLCDASFVTKQELEVHVRRHLNERPFKCEKINCGAAFTTSWNLKNHKNVHNKNNKKFACSVCPFKTHSQCCLKYHIKSVHSELKRFKCPHDNCEYSAKMKSTLNQHLNIHSLEKDQVCPAPNCGFQTKWPMHLTRHMKTHSNEEKRHKCHFCEYASHRHDDLVLHIRRHTGETPFACQLCSFKLKSKKYLNQHMKTHAD